MGWMNTFKRVGMKPMKPVNALNEGCVNWIRYEKSRAECLRLNLQRVYGTKDAHDYANDCRPVDRTTPAWIYHTRMRSYGAGH